MPEEKTDRNAFPPILIIFLTILIDMIGFGIVIPILPLYAQHFTQDATMIGLLFGSFSFMQLIFTPILGRWSDRVGRRPVLLLSILGTAVSFLILGSAQSLWMLFLGRMLDGLSGGNISTAQAYIADTTTLEKRSGAMALIGAAFGLGFVIGPTIGGLLGQYSMQLPFYVAAVLAFMNAIALYFLLPESLPLHKRGAPAAAPPSGTLWQNLLSARQTPLGPIMICSLFSTIAFSLITALFTLFTQHRLNWHAHENGLLFGYIGLLGVLIQGGLVRRLAPRVGEKLLILIGCVFLCVSMALLPLGGEFITVLIASSGLAIGNSLTTPMLSGLASKSTDAESQGAVLGVMQSVASLGRMIGPPIGGYLLSFDALHREMPYGISPFWFAAILMSLAIMAASRLRAGEPAVHLRKA